MKNEKPFKNELEILGKQEQIKKPEVLKNEKIEKIDKSLAVQEFFEKIFNPTEIQKVKGFMKIDNFPEIQKVIGSLIVKNFPDIQKIIGSVKIDNFPKTQKVNGELEISNLQKIDDEEIINRLSRLEKAILDLDFPKPLKEIIVKNFPEVITKLEISKLPKGVIENIISKIENNALDVEEIAEYFGKNPDKFLNVRLSDGKTWYKALSQIATGISNGGRKPRTPEIHTVELADKDTEYSFTIPHGTGKALIKLRDYGYDLRLAYAKGETTTRYITIPAGSAGKELVEVYLYELKIYLRSPDIDNQTVEIELWKY